MPRFDSVVGRYGLTESLVDLLSLERRTTLARFLALAWELAVDVVLALPTLGYSEEPASQRETWRAVLVRCLRGPTAMRWIRPLATALVAVAGACTVARLVQGTVYLSWRELLGDGVAARGLTPAPASSQIVQRDRHAEYFSALALLGASLEKFAVEIRHLQRTEVREAEELGRMFSSGGQPALGRAGAFEKSFSENFLVGSLPGGPAASRALSCLFSETWALRAAVRAGC